MPNSEIETNFEMDKFNIEDFMDNIIIIIDFNIKTMKGIITHYDINYFSQIHFAEFKYLWDNNVIFELGSIIDNEKIQIKKGGNNNLKLCEYFDIEDIEKSASIRINKIKDDLDIYIKDYLKEHPEEIEVFKKFIDLYDDYDEASSQKYLMDILANKDSYI